MKLFLALIFAVSTAYAGTGEILTTCTNTQFQDLAKIVITESDDGTILTSETDEKNNVTTNVQTVREILENKGVKLSTWAGYTRTLVIDGASSYIVTTDECTSSISSLTCTK
jgi:hypothetical protein